MKTKLGTELPLLNLRGKEYLEVKYRVVWFREERPDWTIETEYLKLMPDHSFAKATIRDLNGRIVATAHKFESKEHFNDHMEKSETGAIGRALALCGFGTANTGDELEEGERIVDSPVGGASDRVAEMGSSASSAVNGHPGDYTISFGKYKGKQLKQLSDDMITGYMDWLVGSAKKNGKGLNQDAEFLKVAVNRYFDMRAEHASPPLFEDEPWPTVENPRNRDDLPNFAPKGPPK